MSYTFLQEQGEESSAASFSDIPPYVLSRLNLTAGKFCCSGNATESCPSSLSGTTCEHSTADRGEDSLTLCAEDSLARTSAQPEKAQESKANDQDCGPKCDGSLARYNPHSRSWKTRQCLLQGGLESFSETWPNWGLMHDGECWGLVPLVRHIHGSGCGLLPTPSGTSNHGQNHVCGRLDEWGGASNPWRGTEIGRIACASFEEWVMGWPVMWTAPTPYETDKFRQWLDSHGELSQESEANK